MANATVTFQVYIGTKELKTAIENYAKDIDKPVWEIIAETWTKMLASGDFNISVYTRYEESSETGIDTLKNQGHRRFFLMMPPELVEKVDQVISDLKVKSQKRGIKRSSWTQEAIRRYLEPELIDKGYLDNTQFKDKHQAAKNLITLREHLKLKRSEFVNKYLLIDGELILSYPQYSAIERNGKGNIDRILDRICQIFKIDKDIFYDPTTDFIRYLNQKSF